jgi:hypothetical protein
MKTSDLLGGTALALVMCAAMASAQVQQKSTEEKASPPAQKESAGAAAKGQPEKSTKQSEPRSKSSAQRESGGKDGAESAGKGAKRNSPNEPGTRGSAQAQPTDSKGSTRAQPNEHGTTGAGTQPGETGRKGSAQTEPKDHGAKGGARTQPTEQNSKGPSKEGSAGRVQLSEHERSQVHETLLKEPKVNRIDHVNFSINVGTRVPRSLRLAPLPASVISLVPQYRDHRYFVASDQICIVDPNTYEIDVVLPAGMRTARGEASGVMGRLMLTEQEKRIVLENVDVHGDSTLALGSVSEGSPAPRGVRLETLPDSVVEQVPKLRGYEYFTAENRVAIVDPQKTKVQLVIDAKR